jgi:L-ascorbate metabolism protein UlaG (beta-lactamase superfamily)
MKTTIPLLMMVLTGFTGYAQENNPAKTFEKDTFETRKGKMTITFIGHATLMIEGGNQVIHIDPVSKEADYSLLPKADLILITHEHYDHLDKKAVAMITKAQTKIMVSLSCKGLIDNALVLANGEKQSFGDWNIEAVPAYNIVNKRPDGNTYHPKGSGNGYVITYGGKRLYISGDTENIPEMANLRNIDIAFLPMNLPYTMTPQMVAVAAKSFMPAILYPYHFGDTNPQLLVDLLKDTPIEVRIRKMK